MSHADPFFTEHLVAFKRRYPVHRRYAANPVDAAALVDVVLILFLFFVSSSSYVVQPGIRITLPAATQPDGIPFSSLVLIVSQEGMVFFHDEVIPLEGLAEAFTRMAFENPDQTLIIEADQGVQHSVLVQIYNQAMLAGIKDVGLATRIAQPPGSVPPAL